MERIRIHLLVYAKNQPCILEVRKNSSIKASVKIRTLPYGITGQSTFQILAWHCNKRAEQWVSMSIKDQSHREAYHSCLSRDFGQPFDQLLQIARTYFP